MIASSPRLDVIQFLDQVQAQNPHGGFKILHGSLQSEVMEERCIQINRMSRGQCLFETHIVSLLAL